MVAIITAKRALQPVSTPAAPPPETPRTELHTEGPVTAPIWVICDPPQPDSYRSRRPISLNALRLFAGAAKKYGFGFEDFHFVGLCSPLPIESLNSASRKWAHVQANLPALQAHMAGSQARVVVTLGELASRAIIGKSVAITRARGAAIRVEGRPVLPMLSPSFILRVPDHRPTFEADMLTLSQMRDANWAISVNTVETDYRWCEDISALLAKKPQRIGLDTETTGLSWRDPAVQVITVQISVAPGQSLVCPVDPAYWPKWQTDPAGRDKLVRQLKLLLEDPSVAKVGHNLKFDAHMLRKLGIELAGWEDDTQLLAFAADENMMEKSLDECVRRWVPSMAGYNDANNKAINKANMRAVPHDRMLSYAGGDPDAALRLYEVLHTLVATDPAQYNCYRRILMPAIRTFSTVVERYGMAVDKTRLRSFGSEVDVFLADTYRDLITRVPAEVRRKHLVAKKELKFSRPDFVRDTLFTREGFNLNPVVFTKTTKDLGGNDRLPSTSSKDHLPYFAELENEAGDFVRTLIDYQKTQTLSGTFIGKEETNNGLWQYIAPNGCIYPSYMLHKTVTGRTASADPNGQNFPKRGRWAKAYQSIFVAKPGYRLVSCDLSQIELRIAAWMARDAAMLEIYRSGGDIHTATAKIVSGLSDAAWDALAPAERKLLRTKAKAVNFGFLYGMSWRKFIGYARTDYGVTYTEREAQLTRARFFERYASLQAWHERVREEVRRTGMVRALHGAIRHLPSIYSQDEAIRASAERQAINSPVQRFGSDLGLIAMVQFSQRADPNLMRIIGFIHDALVMEVKIGYELEGINALLYAMENLPLEEWFGITPPLPILAEADIGMNGGAMLELAELPPIEKRPEWFNEIGFNVVNEGGKESAHIERRMPFWWNNDNTPNGQRNIEIIRRRLRL